MSFDWLKGAVELEAAVEQSRDDGGDPVERAEATAELRTKVLRGRSDAFQAATQRKRMPTTYGHGSRERYLKETKG